MHKIDRLLSSSLILSTLVLGLGLLCTSCQTSEDIRRQRMVDDLSMQVNKTSEESKKSTVTTSQQLQDLQDQIKTVSGQYEGILQQQVQTDAERSEQLQKLDERVQALESYIQEVIETLKKMDANGSGKSGKNGKGSKKNGENVNDKNDKNDKSSNDSKESSNYNKGLSAFQKGNYKEAKQLLEGVLGQSGITAAQKNIIQHHLGVVEYQQGQYEKSIIYLSKIYTQYPNSTLAPSALYNIGRSLVKMGKKSEAKLTYQELIKKYPKCEFIGSANKALKEL